MTELNGITLYDEPTLYKREKGTIYYYNMESLIVNRQINGYTGGFDGLRNSVLRAAMLSNITNLPQSLEPYISPNTYVYIADKYKKHIDTLLWKVCNIVIHNHISTYEYARQISMQCRIVLFALLLCNEYGKSEDETADIITAAMLFMLAQRLPVEYMDIEDYNRIMPNAEAIAEHLDKLNIIDRANKAINLLTRVMSDEAEIIIGDLHKVATKILTDAIFLNYLTIPIIHNENNGDVVDVLGVKMKSLCAEQTELFVDIHDTISERYIKDPYYSKLIDIAKLLSDKPILRSRGSVIIHGKRESINAVLSGREEYGLLPNDESGKHIDIKPRVYQLISDITVYKGLQDYCVAKIKMPQGTIIQQDVAVVDGFWGRTEDAIIEEIYSLNSGNKFSFGYSLFPLSDIIMATGAYCDIHDDRFKYKVGETYKGNKLHFFLNDIQAEAYAGRTFERFREWLQLMQKLKKEEKIEFRS